MVIKSLVDKWSGILDSDYYRKEGRYIMDPRIGIRPVKIKPLRRTFPQLVASELVNVQPMTGPIGTSFYMRYKYHEKHGRYIKKMWG